MTQIRYQLILWTLLFLQLGSYAQPCTGISIADADCSPLTIVRSYYDNDFFAGSNRYYTQGIKLEIISPRFMDLYLSRRFLFRVGRRARTYYGLGLSHQAFTPFNIEAADIVSDDRPYAGQLVLSHFLISNDRDHLTRMTTAIDIGVLGPWSGTDLLNNSQNGWDNQIKTDLILAYRAKFEKGIFEVQGADAQLFGQANVGTFRPSLGIGGQLRMGLLNPYFYALHTAKRSLLGSRKIHDRQIFGFVNVGLDLVGYDASLQGGMLNGGLFGNDAYELSRREINRLVAYLELGFQASFKGLMIGYSHNFRSKNFKLGTGHSWGQVRLIVSL